MSNLQIADRIYTSRLFREQESLGNVPNDRSCKASGSELVTMALKRIDHQSDSDDLLTALQLPDVHLSA
jgi:thiazole synthase